ncbi:MAG: SDR family oxidoreductase [Acidimicrobiales bacterium]|jgi:NAD(P)-dependent dehydrogenase (short-subunit alcohol dehydrogenase family)
MKSTELDGKVALVTGASNGIGAAVSRRLAALGTRVVVADVDDAPGSALAKEIDGFYVHCDVRRLDDNVAAVVAAAERFGGLDLVHLNAGVTSGGGVGDDFDLDAYRRAMAINLDGVVFGVHAALPALQARGGGAVIATSSMAGLVPVSLDPVYSANKHAVAALMRSLGQAYVDSGISFNALCPSFAHTGIIEDVKALLDEWHFPILEVDAVVDTFVAILDAGGTGECWYVVPGRQSEPFRFRNVPGPR